MSNESDKIAIFIDVENLTKWVKDDGPEKLLDEIYSHGQPIVRRAYGNWTSPSVTHFQASLNRLGFELVHNFHPVSGKNSSDIQMTVDVIEYAWNLNELSWFVLATGDSDFSPLFRRLREMGKGVIGVGPRSNLSETVKTSCSRYLYTESVTQKGLIAVQSAYADAIDNVEKALTILGDKVPLSTLKSKLLNLDSAFDEKQLGFKSFSLFLESIDDITLDDMKMTCFSSQNNEASIPNKLSHNTEGEDLSSRYCKLLRKMNWRSLPKEDLVLIFKAMKEIPPLPKETLIDALLNTLGKNITQTDVNKAFTKFMKCKLISSSVDKRKPNQYLWVLKDKSMSTDEMLEIRDTALLTRVIDACKETGTPIDTSSLLKITYSKIPLNVIEVLIKKSPRNLNDDTESE